MTDDSNEPHDWRSEFSAFFEADPKRLHFAAHSHHLWPDVTLKAQQQCWRDAARLADTKWGFVLGELLPRAQAHVAATLSLESGESVAFAPNTHEFLQRLFSALPNRPARVLTTDGEFHSFRRQLDRWRESGLAKAHVVPVEPMASFDDRFLDAMTSRSFDLVYVSHVFFNSGLVVKRLEEMVAAAPAEAMFVVDGYHSFFALPTDWSLLQDRAFYLAGGYKYAMAGEGACFLHCPPGVAPRPVNTGWYAAFGNLEEAQNRDEVPYPADGMRFMGSTFDPSGLYRFVASCDRWQELGVGVGDIHRHVRALQARFLDEVRNGRAGSLTIDQLIPTEDFRERGHFLTFSRSDAAALHAGLIERGVVTDYRDDRLRFGFGVYQGLDDVDRLLGILATL